MPLNWPYGSREIYAVLDFRQPHPRVVLVALSRIREDLWPDAIKFLVSEGFAIKTGSGRGTLYTKAPTTPQRSSPEQPSYGASEISTAHHDLVFELLEKLDPPQIYGNKVVRCHEDAGIDSVGKEEITTSKDADAVECIRLGGRNYMSQFAVLQRIRELLYSYEAGKGVTAKEDCEFLNDLWHKAQTNGGNGFTGSPVKYIITFTQGRDPKKTLYAVDAYGHASKSGWLSSAASTLFPSKRARDEDEDEDDPEDLVDELERSNKQKRNPRF